MFYMRIILVLVLLQGCTGEAVPNRESRGKVMMCVDTRDGETFTFRGKDIRNARIGVGGADSCFYVVDTAGKPRTLCKSQEPFIKCVQVSS